MALSVLSILYTILHPLIQRKRCSGNSSWARLTPSFSPASPAMVISMQIFVRQIKYPKWLRVAQVAQWTLHYTLCKTTAQTQSTRQAKEYNSSPAASSSRGRNYERIFHGKDRRGLARGWLNDFDGLCTAWLFLPDCDFHYKYSTAAGGCNWLPVLVVLLALLYFGVCGILSLSLSLPLLLLLLLLPLLVLSLFFTINRSSHQRKQVKSLSFDLHLPLILIPVLILIPSSSSFSSFTLHRPLRDVHESSPLNLNIDSIICSCTLRYLLHRPQAHHLFSFSLSFSIRRHQAWASWASSSSSPLMQLLATANSRAPTSCLLFASLRYCHWCCETNVLSLSFFSSPSSLFSSLSLPPLLPFALILSLSLSPVTRLRLYVLCLCLCLALNLLTVLRSCSSWSVNQSSLQVDSTQPVRLIVTLIWFAKLASPLSHSLPLSRHVSLSLSPLSLFLPDACVSQAFFPLHSLFVISKCFRLCSLWCGQILYFVFALSLSLSLSLLCFLVLSLAHSHSRFRLSFQIRALLLWQLILQPLLVTKWQGRTKGLRMNDTYERVDRW